VIVYNGTFAVGSASTTGGFAGKLAGAKNAVRGTAGAYLEPAAVFFTPSRWEYIAGWADGQGRPILLPAAGEDNPRQYGDTGIEWGGLHVHTDPNIPLLGTTNTDQAIVADPSEVFVWKSATPTVDVFEQPGASLLNVLIRANGYAGCIVRYPSGVQAVAGTAMAPVSF